MKTFLATIYLQVKSSADHLQTALTESEKFTLKLGLLFSVLKPIFDQYFFSDWDFLFYLGVLILLDTATGISAALYQKQKFESRKLTKFFIKLIVYTSALILTHVLINYKVQGETNSIFQWVDSFIYSIVISREVTSIIENLLILAPDLFPASFHERFSNYKKTGKLSDLTKQP